MPPDALKAAAKPCAACPWRLTATADQIPNFEFDRAEGLARTCPDARGMGPDMMQPLFACHESTTDHEFACAGWLATVGINHPLVRLALATGRLSPRKVSPRAGWPELHDNYADVLAKLRRCAG